MILWKWRNWSKTEKTCLFFGVIYLVSAIFWFCCDSDWWFGLMYLAFVPDEIVGFLRARRDRHNRRDRSWF
jgi:hypothetical protein